MNPTEFQTLAIGWIGTAVVVGVALIAAYATLKGKIADLQAKHEHNADVLQSHEDRITMLDEPLGQPRNVAFQPSIIPDLSDEGLQLWKDNVDVLGREYTKATGISEDKADMKDVLQWMKANIEVLRPLLHPRTAMLLPDPQAFRQPLGKPQKP